MGRCTLEGSRRFDASTSNTKHQNSICRLGHIEDKRKTPQTDLKEIF